MKIIFKTSAIVLLMTLLFAACNKDNIDEIIYQEPTNQVDTVGINPLFSKMQTFSTDTIHIDCVKIPFPVDFKQASGSTLTVNNEADFLAAANLADSLVDFIYPFQAFVNGTSTPVQTIQDLALALVTCDTAVAGCDDFDAHVLLFFPANNILSTNQYKFSINYPVTIIVEGNPVVLNSDADYLPAIGGSPFNYDETELVYPITITQFGQTIVLNNDQDVCDFNESLNEPCANKPEHIQFFFNELPGTRSSCVYTINYPVNITLNGQPQQIQSSSDYLNLLDNNASAYNGINLVYPVTAVTILNGQNLSFNAAGDVCQYLDNCQ